MTPTTPICGHERHETITVPIDLNGARFHDFAIFPPARRQRFDLEVFDYHRYKDAPPGFCPGREGSFDGILEQQIWESWETRYAVEVFARSKPGLVIDIGTSAGWYSVLAALAGHEVFGVEADRETAELARRNLARVGGRGDIAHATVGPDMKEINVGGSDVVFWKSDVEGAEHEAIEASFAMFKERRISFGLIEVSPCFRKGYDRLLSWIRACGYGLYLVPNKTCTYREAFGADPLAELHRTEIHDPISFVAGIRQENVALVRR